MEAQGNKIKYVKISRGWPMMELARVHSRQSTDLRKPIGSVVVKDGVVVGMGSNQATIRCPWVQNWHKTHCVRKILGIKTHDWYFICPGCALFKNHSESQAVRNVNPQLGPYELYLYGHYYCCYSCERKLLKHNVKRVYTL